MKDLGPGYSLNGDFEVWEDTEFYFIKRNPSIPQSYYFRDLSEEFSNDQDFPPPEPYNKEAVDLLFGSSAGAGSSASLLGDVVLDESIDEMVWAVFHFDADISWRWAEPGEKIYYWPGDGYVGVWLEHLRSGYHPRCHQFLKSLCIHEYGISVTQLVPNVVKWISYFLGSCYKGGYLPTFKLFHHIYWLVHSNHFPMYELRFRGDDCGYASGVARPVVMLPSLKEWN